MLMNVLRKRFKVVKKIYMINFLISIIFVFISLKIIRNKFDMFSKLFFDRIQNLLGLRMPPFIYEDIGQFP